MDKKEKELKMLEVLARKLLTCKPDGLPKEPRKYPSKKQLEDVFFLDKETMTIEKLDEPNT